MESDSDLNLVSGGVTQGIGYLVMVSPSQRDESARARSECPEYYQAKSGLASLHRAKIIYTPYVPLLLARLLLPGHRSHQPLPLSQRATKPQITGPLPARLRCPFASFAALGIWHVPVLAARNEDVRRKRVMLGAYLFQRRLGLA